MYTHYSLPQLSIGRVIFIAFLAGFIVIGSIFSFSSEPSIASQNPEILVKPSEASIPVDEFAQSEYHNDVLGAQVEPTPGNF